jgi:hypothetical protein
VKTVFPQVMGFRSLRIRETRGRGSINSLADNCEAAILTGEKKLYNALWV